MEIQWVVRKEVEDESDVRDGPRQNHPLWRLLVCLQAVVDASDERDLIAEAQDFPGLRHGDSELGEALDQGGVVGALGVEGRDDTHDKVLDDSAHFVATDPRVYVVGKLIEETDDCRGR